MVLLVLNHVTGVCKAVGSFLVPPELYCEIHGQQQGTLGGTFASVCSLWDVRAAAAGYIGM